jgi:SAM-dependent methyltransferase
MGIRGKLTAQFGKPSGTAGYFIGWFMSVSNKSLSDWAIEKIPVQNTDRILEIGYGTGHTFGKMAGRVPEGFIAGIDHSPLMYKIALRRNQHYCDTQKAILQCIAMDDISFAHHYFDTVFGNNVHFFWSNPVQDFYKLRTLLKPGGKLVMIFQPRWARSAVEVQKVAIETSIQFQLAGFSEIEIEYKRMKPIDAIAVTGINNPAYRK